MKRNLIQILFPALLLGTALFTSCADDAIMEAPEVLQQENDEAQQTVWRLVANMGGESEDSRLAYLRVQGTFMTTWEATDSLAANANPGVDETYAYIFTLTDGSGTSSATFECKNFPSGVAPEEQASSKWTIYYPGSKIQSENDFFNMSYLGQVQYGNGSYAHIADYHALRLPYGDKKTEVTLDNVLLDLSSDEVQESSCMVFNLSGFSGYIVPTKIQLEYLNPEGNPEKVFYTHNYSPSYWEGAVPVGSTTSILTLELDSYTATNFIQAYLMMSSYPTEVQKGGTFRIYVTDAGGNTYTCDKVINRDATLRGGLLHQINYNGEWTGGSQIDGMNNPEEGIVVLQEASVGNGSDIIIMGDGFAKEHFLNGNYEAVMKQAAEAFFSVEPYTSLRKYFNVYYINAVSDENHDAKPYWSGGVPGSGAQNGATMGTANTKFSTQFQEGSTSVSGNNDLVMEYMLQSIRHKGGKGGTPVTNENEVQRRAFSALALVQVNVKCYAGTCTMYLTNATDYCNAHSIGYTPLGHDDTGEQCRLTTVHEAGGHGFGKLADEYQVYYFSSFSTSLWDDLRTYHTWGCFRNVNEYWTDADVEASGGWDQWEHTTKDNVYWAELLRPEYTYTTTEGLGMYKGGWTYVHLFCRPTNNSMMNYQFGVDGQNFNAISRWAIWYRLMKLTGSTTAADFKSSLDEFIAFDKTITGWESSTSSNSMTNGQENFVEQKLEPLAPPVLKRGEWINGRFVEVE